MRGIEELERALDELASTAPSDVGLVDSIKADAQRIRHRRRILAISATSAVLAVVLVGVPTAISGLGQRAPDPAATTAYRGPLDLTVDLAPESGGFKLTYGMARGVQHIEVRPTAPEPGADGHGSVFVYDPGVYDATHLMSGERITIQGRTAYYVSDLPLGKRATLPSSPGGPGPVTLIPSEVRAPAVGWQDASGAWVVVTSTAPPDAKAKLVRLAESVRLGGPRDLVAPFSLGYVPAGLGPQYAGIRDHSPDNIDVLLAFGTGNEPVADPIDLAAPFGAAGLPLTVRALKRTDYLAFKTIFLGPPTRIAGHDVWYITESNAEWKLQDNGSVLVFHHGQCLVMINVADRARIPLPELTRMLENARFTDCTDTGTWIRPLA